MKAVAKLIIIDSDGKYLMMYRNNHPTFGNDPDLPGGEVEPGETFIQAMVREVYEEIGVIIDAKRAQKIYSGVEYSEHGTNYSLFLYHASRRPTITMSWEHLSYEWVDKDTFIKIAASAQDTYMHMASDTVEFLSEGE